MSGHVGVDGIETDAIAMHDVAMHDVAMHDIAYQELESGSDTRLIELNGADMEAIRRGTRLAPGEAVVWQGSPSWRSAARDVFHLRGLSLYFLLLFALDGYQAWVKGLPLAKAAHDSVPLLAITVFVLILVASIAWFSSRTTRYVVTPRRIILHYGIAMPATLSLPFAQIVGASVSVRRDHTGDIALTLKVDNHMPLLKLWPLARPWHVTKPQPMLRGVPQAGVVGALLVRTLHAAEQRRAAIRPAAMPVREAMPELLSA